MSAAKRTRERQATKKKQKGNERGTSGECHKTKNKQHTRTHKNGTTITGGLKEYSGRKKKKTWEIRAQKGTTGNLMTHNKRDHQTGCKQKEAA